MLDEELAAALALGIDFEWSEADRVLLQPLVDLEVVWAEGEQVDCAARDLVEMLWLDELREDIERALDHQARASDFVAEALAAARADLALGPGESRLAVAVIKQAALNLAGAAMLPGMCLCCAEDGLGVAPPERHAQIALVAAVGIVVRADPDFGEGRPTPARCGRARDRLREIGGLAAESLPRLSAALLQLADEPVEASADPLWQRADAERRAFMAAWN